MVYKVYRLTTTILLNVSFRTLQYISCSKKTRSLCKHFVYRFWAVAVSWPELNFNLFVRIQFSKGVGISNEHEKRLLQNFKQKFLIKPSFCKIQHNFKNLLAVGCDLVPKIELAQYQWEILVKENWCICFLSLREWCRAPEHYIIKSIMLRSARMISFLAVCCSGQ